MKNIPIFIYILLFILTGSFHQNHLYAGDNTKKIWVLNGVGTSNVFFRILTKPGKKIFMINVHEDETASIDAGKRVLEEFGGTFVFLVHQSTRIIAFHDEKFKRFRFNPNRMFSDEGIRKTLKKHSQYSAFAHREIKKFANEIIKQFLTSRKHIIALHNNPDNNEFNVMLYSTKKYRKHIRAIHVDFTKDLDNFYYVTEKAYFDFLAGRGHNVVLQNNNDPPNDGSLSEYCGKKNIPYINIECQDGAADIQFEMLKEAIKAVEQYPR